MKKLLLISFLLVSNLIFGQTSPQDTNYFCIPNEIARKILLDLNELDKLKEVDKLTKKEIESLEEKIGLKDSTILKLKDKDTLNQVIITNLEEKVSLVEDENDLLKKDIKHIKFKNRVFQILSGAIIGTLTYFLLI